MFVEVWKAQGGRDHVVETLPIRDLRDGDVDDRHRRARPPARVWVQLQRTHADGPLIAMNVTDDAARAEEWRRMGRTVVEHAPAAEPDRLVSGRPHGTAGPRHRPRLAWWFVLRPA
jgi:hypothetical protein